MIKVAVIGVGKMGHSHARLYHDSKQTKLVAVCDTDEKIGQEIAIQFNCKYYKSYSELIHSEPLDAVSIATPTSQHKEVALMCIQQGIHILIEKPLAPTTKDAFEIAYKAKKKGIILLPGHIERYNPAIQKLEEMIDQEELGKVISIVVKRVGLFPPRIKDANVITDLGVHDLDIICKLAKRTPFYITATAGKYLNDSQEDHAEIFMDYGNFGCFIQVNWLTPIKIRSLSITGTRAYCEVDYINQSIDFYKSSLDSDNYKDFEDMKNRLAKSERITINSKIKEPLKLELDNFINSILGKEQPRVTSEEAVRAVHLSEIVMQSYLTGEKSEVIR